MAITFKAVIWVLDLQIYPHIPFQHAKLLSRTGDS